MKPNRIRVAQLSIALALAAIGTSAGAAEKTAPEPSKPAVAADKAAAPSAAAPAQAPALSSAAPAAAAPVAAAPEPAPAAQKASAGGELNPFTGQRQAAEQSKRQAEEVRAQNQLLEERIRQAALMSDLQNTPLRKQMEMQKLIDQNKPPAPVTPPAAAPAPAKDVALEPAKKSPQKPDLKKPAASKPVAPVAAPAPAVLKPPAPELVGVIRTKEGVTAIVSNEGRTILARPGEQTSLGRVDEVTQDTARIGADKLVYRANRAARVALTDTPPASAATTTAGAAQARNVALPPAPPYQSGLQLPQVPGVPPSASARDIGLK